MSKYPVYDQDPGFSDELNYAFLVDDGVICCADGTLGAGWIIEGEDSESWGMGDKTSRANRINDAFIGLGSGWSLWHDLVCDETSEYADAAADCFHDKVTQKIDDERRDFFQGSSGKTLVRRIVLFLGYTPESKIARKSGKLFFDETLREGTEEVDDKKKALDELALFNKKIEEFENSLQGVLRLDRLSGYEQEREVCSDIVNYIDFRISGVSREVALTQEVVELDAVLNYKYLDTRSPLKIGDDYIITIAIDGFPKSGHPGILNALSYLKAKYVWSTRFIIRDRQAALAEIKTTRKSWRAQARGLRSLITRREHENDHDSYADTMAADTSNAEHKASSAEVVYGFYTSNVILRGTDYAELKELSKKVIEAIQTARFNAREESINDTEAFIGSLPLHPVHNIRRPMLNSRNFADLVCWDMRWRGPEKNSNPYYPDGSNPLMYALTRGNEPFRVDVFDSNNGNVLMFGPSDTGKTAALNAIVAQQNRYKNNRNWGWDFKYGMYTLAKECGWDYYDLGAENELTLCPLWEIADAEDAKYAKAWIEDRFESKLNRKPSPKQSREIHITVELMRQFDECRSLSDFCALVQDDEVRDTIRHFTIEGSGGLLLDAEFDTLSETANAIFECESFINSSPSEIVSATFSYLLRKFERGLNIERPSSVVLDEAHYWLRSKFLCPALEAIVRTIRSKNGYIVLATQSIKEAVDNNVGMVLFENCPTKIFLPNANAKNMGTSLHPGPYDFYKMIGCTEEDIAIIAEMRKKQEYYLCKTGNQKQVINLALSGTLLEIISRPVSRQIVQRLAAA